MRFRYVSFILAVALAFSISSGIGFAKSEDENINPYIAAEQLSQLGLLKGVSRGSYDMARNPTRAESVVMLIRLLGKEKEALRHDDSNNPFYDVPAWAAKYVAYAYANGLTKGISERQFGAGLAVDVEQYTTFLLRALNYSDEKDFSYGASKVFASSLGLFNGWTDGEKFLRSDMIILSFNALNADFNGFSGTLADYLVRSGAITSGAWETVTTLKGLSLVPRSDYEWEEMAYISLRSTDNFLIEFKNSLERLPDAVLVAVPYGEEKKYFDYFDIARTALNGYAREYQVWYTPGTGSMRISVTYTKGHQSLSYLKNPTVPVSGEIKDLALRGLKIYTDRFSAIEYDYDLAKAVHDYIADKLEYDTKYQPGSEDFDGPMNRGVATCGGYSAMFLFFMRTGGIEAEMVVGTATNNRGVTENHAWNKVKLNSNWYNIDVTWNDPITHSGVGEIVYDYFLISDNTLSRDHSWNKSHYPPSPNSWNFRKTP